MLYKSEYRNLNKVILGGLVPLLSGPNRVLGVFEILKSIFDILRLLLINLLLDIIDKVVDVINRQLN